jgi:hypothetical protein
MGGTYTQSTGHLSSVSDYTGAPFSGWGIEPCWAQYLRKLSVSGIAVWEFTAPHDGEFQFYISQSTLNFSSVYSSALSSPPSSSSSYTTQSTGNNAHILITPQSMSTGNVIYFTFATSFWGYNSGNTGGAGTVAVWYTSPPPPTAASIETFSDPEKSMDDIRQFLNGKDGIGIAQADISIANLFAKSLANDVSLPNGNFIVPHALNEFEGANYSDQSIEFAMQNSEGFSHMGIETIIPSSISYDYLEFKLGPDYNWLKMTDDFRLGSKFNYSSGQIENIIQYGHLTNGYMNWENVSKNGVELTFSSDKDAWAEIKQIRSSPNLYTIPSNNLGSLPNLGADYELYVRIYSDLIRSYKGYNAGRTIAKFGEDHWLAYGQSEGRTLPVRSLTNYYIRDRSPLSYAYSTGGTQHTKRFFCKFDKPYIDQNFGIGHPGYYKANRTTSTRSGGSYSYTVPNGVTSIEIHAVGGGGGSWGAHTGGYCQNVWAGGVGGGVKITLPVQSGDVISGVFGDAGGAGFYNGGTGGPGSATTVLKNGTLVATCNPGGQGNSAPASPGTATIAPAFSSLGSTYVGTSQQNIFVGCDSSTSGNGYDPWNWIDRGGKYADDAGGLPFNMESKVFDSAKIRTVTLDSSNNETYKEFSIPTYTVHLDRFEGGRPQCNGYVKIKEL